LNELPWALRTRLDETSIIVSTGFFWMEVLRRRREFITLLGGAAVALPLAAGAQGEQLRRIAVFMDLAEADQEGQARIAALKRGLQDLGWIEGRNLRIESRWAAGQAARMKPLAEELVSLAPEVIVSSGAPTLAALQQTTRTIPLVFGQVVDPVAAGFVDSLSRPGGNIIALSDGSL
jgi:putative tryptophan/tyrosine transport system substrate-binding protein